ncbi:MAG: TIGR02922 family protein [Thalassotalea sp.]
MKNNENTDSINILASKEVTIIYYSDHSMELMHDVKSFPQNGQGRVCIPEQYKRGKSIIAVCDGQIEILNKLGERIIPASQMLFKTNHLIKKAN